MNINVTAGLPAKRPSMGKRISPSLSFSAAALAVLFLSAPVPAQTSKPAFKPLDVFDLQWAADPQVSPDGRNIAYVRMGFDIKTDRPRGTVWLVGVDGKNERPLSGAPASGSPRWSPDGTRIAYIARASDGSAQLFMYWTASGVSAPVSNFTESPSGLAWSPDGRWLAFTMSVAAGTQTAQGRIAGNAQERQVGGSAEADRSDGVSRRRRRLPAEHFQPSIRRLRGRRCCASIDAG